MKKFLLAVFASVIAFCASSATPDEATKENLRQLASEFSSFVVGTSDKTFESCTYTDGMITFVINPKSNIGKYRIANPFDEDFYNNLMTQMFSANPQQGITVMEYLKTTAPSIRFIIPGNSESTIFVGNVIPLLKKLQQ